jgi:hypothetical protein
MIFVPLKRRVSFQIDVFMPLRIDMKESYMSTK